MRLLTRAASVPSWAGAKWRRVWNRRRFAAIGTGGAFGAHLLVIRGDRIRIGSDFSCWRFCTLAACADGVIEIGDRVSLNSNVYINACCGGLIRIGHDVLIGPNVVLRASDHAFDDLNRPIREQGHVPGVIAIEDDVWLSANVTVVGGVRIGRGAIVAAGAVVTRDVEPQTVVGGVPATVIRRRTPQDAIGRPTVMNA